ncbi:unnamed protein product [marine sediment metagenome]|uniref:Uncharacterized protein n=1 Tax=marine sediment metagenome TaxID=412755 RepID=X1VI39_9ZZZZ
MVKEGVAGINWQQPRCLAETLLSNAQVGSDLLQIALLILRTGEAITGVVSDKQLYSSATHLVDCRCLSVHYHPISS